MTKTLRKSDLSSAKLFVGLAGGEVVVSNADGVFMFSVGYAPGIHDAEPLRAHMQATDELTLVGDMTWVKHGGRLQAANMGQWATQTGANPDWRPTNATAQELRMRKMLKDLSAAQTTIDKRIAALSKAKEAKAAQITKEREAKKQEAAKVVEPVAETEPKA